MKIIMNGKSFPKITSKAYPVNLSYGIAEYILLAGIGALGVLIHAYLRIPMRLPGHQGIIYMALLLSGKLISKKDYASSLSSIGAASMLLIPLGFKDPYMPVIYLFPGFIVDVLFYIFRKFQTKIVFLAVICGLAYMTIPVTRIVITSVTGFQYGSLAGGIAYPFILHFIFGATGGLIASGIFRKK